MDGTSSAHDVDRLCEIGEAIADARARYEAEVGPLIAERDPLIRGFYRDGLSYRDIAALASISHIRVRTVILAARVTA